MRSRGLLLLLACAWTGCGQPKRAAGDEGGLRAVAACAPTDLGATLREHPVLLIDSVSPGRGGEPEVCALSTLGELAAAYEGGEECKRSKDCRIKLG